MEDMNIYTCWHPSVIKMEETIDLVTGEKFYRRVYPLNSPIQHNNCSSVRSHDSLCGSVGKLWEEKFSKKRSWLKNF